MRLRSTRSRVASCVLKACRSLEDGKEKTEEPRPTRPMRLVAPDGGWGWIVLLSGLMINFLIPGTIKSFGVLYVEFLRVFEASPTEASWMPALCYFLFSSLSPLASILSIKYSYRSVTLVGGLFAASGLMLSYFASSVTYLYFSFGIMVGVGAGLTFPLTIYIVSEYFERRRGMASGLCISGSAIGTIMLAPFLQYMLDQLGYRFSVLIMGGILLNTLACALTFHPVEQHMKLVPIDLEQIVVGLDPPRASLHELSQSTALASQLHPATPADGDAEDQDGQSLFDLRILRDPFYLVILISISTSTISNTNFMILLPVYAVSQGYDKESSALLLSIVSLLDLIGRIGGATLSDLDLVPKHYYFVGGLGASGVALALLPVLDGYAYLASFCALFGLLSGVYIGTTTVVLADMLGPETLASSYGISRFVNGLLQLVGPPLGNLTYERLGSFKPIFMALGIISVCGAALWAAIPLIRRSKEVGQKSANESANELPARLDVAICK